MKDDIRVKAIDAWAYFASIGLGLKWYKYDDLKKIQDLRLATTAIGSLPTQLAELVAEDAAEMGLAA
ncbi:MAG: hypothetical protein P8075_01515 [Deltaproteobacteria bacterium]|jgi:hypothetical protein